VQKDAFALKKADREVKDEEKQRHSQAKKLSLNQIALVHIYKKIPIDDNNKNQIAKLHGWTSGHALFQKYKRWSKIANRLHGELTPTQKQNRIALFNSIIPLLNDQPEAQKHLKNELQTLSLN